MEHLVSLGLIEPPRPGDLHPFSDRRLAESLEDWVHASIESVFLDAFGSSLSNLRITRLPLFVCIDGIVATEMTLANFHRLGALQASGTRIIADFHNEALVDAVAIEDGPGVSISQQRGPFDIGPTCKIKPLKKAKRFEINIQNFHISSEAFDFNAWRLHSCPCQNHTITMKSGYPVVSFFCFVCGNKYLCECTRGIAEAMLDRKGYNVEPYEKLLSEATYRHEICHLCRGIPSTTKHAGHNQSEVRLYYAPYVHTFAQKHGWDFRSGENEIRDRLSVPRIGEGWLNEANLLRLIRSLFPDEKVIHQASPAWIGRQRLDIFMPERKLAVEYNGEQHYRPIDRFGGEAGLIATQRRDAEKQAKLQANGIRLIEFRFDEEITPEIVKARIDAAGS